MQCRKPIVAGQFYPDDKDDCLAEIKACLDEEAFTGQLPREIAAGIVPHAGWFFSGQVAAMVFAAIKKQNGSVDTFVIFGTAHSYFGTAAAVYDRGCWQSPLGEAAADIIGAEKKKKIICIGSTDLTHYGPRYGFTPVGVGQKAIEWAGNVNDKQFIDLAIALEPEKLLNTAAENSNACGPGAAAATVSAAKKLGKQRGLLLKQTNSSEIMLKKMNRASSESVGYAAIVF
jgi:predicted class III extradiol MEMO1 family dioxygenase